MSTAPALPAGFQLDGPAQTPRSDVPPGFVQDNPAPAQSDAAQPSSPAAQQPAQPGIISQLGSAAADAGENFLTGVAKGAGQTVNTVSKALHAIPVVGETLAPSAGISAADTLETPHGVAQNFGVGAESIAEAVLGDEALKGLSIGDKLLHAGKVAEMYDRASPFVKQVIAHGLSMAHAGAVTGGETLAKTGDIGEAAKAGAVGAVAAPIVNAALSPVEAASKLWQSVTGKAIQDELKGGVRSVVNDVASDTGVKAPVGSLRTSVEQIADGVQSKAKGLFQQIDDATGGDFTNLQNKLKNVTYKLRDITGTDDALESKLEEQAAMLRSRLEDSIEAAQQNGVAPEVADQAKAAWRQMSALRDVDSQLKAAIAGNVKNAPEVIDPAKLAPRLQKLEDSGRLAEAMGKSAANDLLQAAYDAKAAAISHANKLGIAKYLGYVAGTGGVLGGAMHVLGCSK